jgi:hypothetical protein
MWDSAIEREDKRDELGSRFEGFVEFEDSREKKFDNPAILDWEQSSQHNVRCRPTRRIGQGGGGKTFRNLSRSQKL